jgi:hypothetical protein
MNPTEIRARLIDLAAVAGVLAETLTHFRHVHPEDRGKPETAGVANALARDLGELRDEIGIDSKDDPRTAAGVGPQVVAAMARAGWRRVARSGRGDQRRTVYRRGAP